MVATLIVSIVPDKLPVTPVATVVAPPLAEPVTLVFGVLVATAEPVNDGWVEPVLATLGVLDVTAEPVNDG